MGHLIPAGTGVGRYRWIRVEDDVLEEDEMEPMVPYAEEPLAAGAPAPPPDFLAGDEPIEQEQRH